MLGPALAEFQRIVGAEHTLTGGDVQRYGWCTLPTERQISAVVRPSSLDEICQVVEVCRTHGIPLYPISTGNNWGYGSALPVRNQNVILDLGRLNRIIEVNRELAYAVVEPGVTQRQLFEHLRDHDIPLWLNPTGAGPDCSILGNTLERGFGIGPNGDHFLAQCGMEVLLASGELLRTGFGHYPGAKATYVYKWGVGPYLDGLFTQSNCGIVTKIGVWLMPVPEHFEACYITCHSEEQLGPLIDGIRELLFAGAFKGPMNLLHRNRALIMLGGYPWEEMDGSTPLAESAADQLARRRGIGVWNGVGSLCGSRAQVRAAKAMIKRTLTGKVDRLTFLSDSRIQLLARFPNLVRKLTGINAVELLSTLQASYGMMKGIPSEVALPLAYWRNRRSPPAGEPLNPARDNCGLIWFAPIVPMTRHHVQEFRAIVEPILARHRFECCLTFTAVNERCFDCTLPLLYDRDNPEESLRADACYHELSESCMRQGYVAYRFGLQSMPGAAERGDVFWDVVERLKNVLDPSGILAPGRYTR